MTLPVERSRSIRRVRNAAYNILAHTPRRRGAVARVPAEELRALHLALRHYPFDVHIEESSRNLPDIWGPFD